ncbi:helix-turn-helix domain-containing protein [Williamsia deligens]|uniref:Helix-turn-helix domain-containing protein n=1 Tax=Williamsia deligens TaxID=321325 RepID=A0ABW3GCW9_9NOCA|nr:DNA binding domain-containing protein, excisionase family [Williamsia deligens]
MTYMTLREASVATGLSIGTLRNYIRSGRLPASRRGPKILVVSTTDVENLTVPRT